MYNQKQLIKLIALFNELTQKGKLKWKRGEPPEPVLLSHDNRIDFVYTTIFEDKILRIYEERFKCWSDEETYSWDSHIVLDFADGEGRSLWQFQLLPGFWDLFESVKYQSANVDSTITAILDKFGLD